MYLDNNYTTAFNQVLVIMYYSRDHNFHILSQTDGVLPRVTSKKIHADIAKKLLSSLIENGLKSSILASVLTF